MSGCSLCLGLVKGSHMVLLASFCFKDFPADITMILERMHRLFMVFKLIWLGNFLSHEVQGYVGFGKTRNFSWVSISISSTGSLNHSWEFFSWAKLRLLTLVSKLWISLAISVIWKRWLLLLWQQFHYLWFWPVLSNFQGHLLSWPSHFLKLLLTWYAQGRDLFCRS